MTLNTYTNFLHRCFRCGYCKMPSKCSDYNCPSYNRYRMESYSPGGQLWLIRAIANKELMPSVNYAEILYSCTMCGNCREHCWLEFKDDLINIMTAAREQLVDESILPLKVQKYLENLYTFNNPWKKSPKTRGAWATGTGIHIYNSTDEYLYYVGDVSSYVPRAIAACRTIGELFLECGVSFGIMGAEEISDGNEARAMGETALFEYLMEKNIDLFKEKKITKIITHSPHAYNIMKNVYGERYDSISVFHYLDIMKQLLCEDSIDVSGRQSIKVTYHDSCFLGRWNKKYELPREILRQIPTIQLVEMERNKENSFCCGGGLGNIFTDMLGGDKNSPARVRVREALSCGAEIIAVSCPTCLIMLDDAVMSERVEDQIKVLDIAEIINLFKKK